MNREMTSVIAGLRNSAKHFPNNLAIRGHVQKSYGDLYTNVQALAGFMSFLGITKGNNVAIFMGKSIDYVTGIYATLECGAVYVPLDGAQPIDRACKIINKSEAKILITSASKYLLIKKQIDSIKNVILVEDRPDGSPITGEKDCNVFTIEDSLSFPTHNIAPAEPDLIDNAAILFTSGSTGTPKGVKISHENLANFICWACNELDLNSTDSLSNHAGFHFDLSTFDLFAASMVGASVWIIDEKEQRDVAALVEGIKKHRITVWYSVPSILILVLNSNVLEEGDLSSIRHLVFAGEVFPIKHLRTLSHKLGVNCSLYNWYGPTETNVCSSHKVCQEDLDRDIPVPIGKPITGADFKVIDSRGHEVTGVGDEGELRVWGSCVTPGYYKHIDSYNYTNHLAGLHATNDLVRIGSDGELSYLGRKDRMVKVNGYRVELGEVESALTKVENILEAAVICRMTESSQDIIAYYTLADSSSRLSILKIKSILSEIIQRYMIPKSAYYLENMPKNPNGKIDYQCLERELESFLETEKVVG